MRPLLILILSVPAAAQRVTVPRIPSLSPTVRAVPSLAPAPVVPSLTPSAALTPLLGSPALLPSAVSAAQAAPSPLAAAPELERLAAGLAVLPPAQAAEAARPVLDEAFAGALSVPADAPLPEFTPAPAPRLLDRRAFSDSIAKGRLSFGAELRSPNPVSMATLAGEPALSAVFVDAAAAPRGRVSALVNAAGRGSAAVIGRFRDARDPGLKPRLDEGLLGATLVNPKSLSETRRFLQRLYTPPLGERSVGPSDVTDWLDKVPEFTAKNNAAFMGGVTIDDGASASAVGELVAAKAQGLRFIEAGPSLSAAQQEAVEAAARDAGIPLVGHAADRAAAESMAARGYAHVIVADEGSAVAAAFAAFEDAPSKARAGWLEKGNPGHVSFLMSPDPLLARELASRSDAVLLDGESGHFTPEAVAGIVKALPRGYPVLVRTSGVDDPALAGYLQAGAAGLVAPQVGDPKEAKDFVAAVNAAKPGAPAVVMLESRRGLEHAESIAAVPGVAAVFLGPYDLSLSIGAAPDSAEFKAAVARIEAAAQAIGVPLGGLAKTRSQADALGAKGYGFVLGVADQPSLAARLRAALAPAARVAAPASEAVSDSAFRRARNIFLAVVAASVSIGTAVFGYTHGLAGVSEYLTTYGIELALSTDNLMAFALIFAQLNLPEKKTRQLLRWGLLAALIMRVAAVSLGLQAVAALTWAVPVGGAVLLLLGGKMLVKQETEEEADSKMVRFLSEKLKLGPAAVALAGVVLLDLIFAVDSIPTALGISSNLPLIITANVFSVLGLAQLYVLLQKLMHKFTLVPKGVGLSLMFIGVKMLLESLLHLHVGAPLSLLAVALLIGGSVALSLRSAKA